MQYREFGVAEPYLRGLVAAVCAYEVVAITTHKVPTVSWFARRHPVIGTAVLAVLAKHFQPLDPE
jgi:hypothetical protein